MVFRHFRIQIVLRVIGILASSIALAWAIYETEFFMTPLVFGLFTLIQAILLIQFVEKSGRQLNSFLQSFADQDYTRKFEPQYGGKVFGELSDTFNQLLSEYSRLSLERQGQYEYVKQMNEHVQVALISYKSDGKIDLMNKAAQSLLNAPLLYRLEDILNYDGGLLDIISNMNANGRELYKSPRRNLAVASKQFKLANEQYTLVALQDISNELQANELDAWQKLIRVLTHEIMNSMTPVLSLSTAVKKIVVKEEQIQSVEDLSQEDISDIHKSISAIEKRGDGLLKFVNAYRDYTKTPELQVESTSLKALVEEVLTLYKEQLETAGIEVVFKPEPKLGVFEIDPKLITQVLINLLKNAIEALSTTSNPKIVISLKTENGNQVISIVDNGPGIAEELLQDIFVPFFTTKKEGSGIGLSLSRQIIRAHGGELSLVSNDQGSAFIITFSTRP